MKLQIKTTFDFGKLAKFVTSESFTSQVSKMLGGGIIESSRAFMKSGGVTPKLEQPLILVSWQNLCNLKHLHHKLVNCLVVELLNQVRRL